jgi:lipopolysaccharide/colanic/teichoic acid biosynthesis glycosyltransferase
LRSLRLNVFFSVVKRAKRSALLSLLTKVMKRLFDIVVSMAGLGLLLPLFLIAAVAIKLDSRGPVFFRQQRMGRRFRPFLIYKFRTMTHDPKSAGTLFTVRHDPRITRVGHFLRKSKIDELPQLINVAKGEMTFVGPRPEVPSYVELFRADYEEILRVRPGITDLASIKYRDEATVLSQSPDPEAEYVNRVLPDKIKLAKEYIRQSSFLFDLGLMFKTFYRLFQRGLA